MYLTPGDISAHCYTQLPVGGCLSQ